MFPTMMLAASNIDHHCLDLAMQQLVAASFGGSE
jgi:hypothetical protein